MITCYMGRPDEHTLIVANGRVVRQGRAVSCLVTSRRRVLAVPGCSIMTRMSFSARSSDMQPVDIEGELAYKVVSPVKAASNFDFSIDPKTNSHISDGPGSLRRAVLCIARDLVRDEISRASTEQILGKEHTIGRAVLIRLRHSPRLREMGVRPLDVFVRELRMRPETIKLIEDKAAVKCVSEMTLAHGGSDALTWKPSAEETTEGGEHSAGMECNDNCPFRYLCGDYHNEVRGGTARCTLFRELST